MAFIHEAEQGLQQVTRPRSWNHEASLLGRPKSVSAGAEPRPLRALGPSKRTDPNDLQYNELEIRYDAEDKILWQFMRPKGRPSYTLGLIDDIHQTVECVERMYAEAGKDEEAPVQYLVLGSRMPGIFNLGGDLPLFVELIRAGDREGLRHYAHACVNAQYLRATNSGLPYISIALVQGDALGGGFEAALADDVIVAERSAKFGLPEVLFNLFPGMGAYSFLSRRLGAVQAERMILSGQIYSAAELYEMGVVDELAEDGQGEEAVYDFVARNRRSFHVRRAVCEARRIANPITHEELISITDLWVDAALSLAPLDLRKMERLAKAQDRKRAM